MHFSDQTWSNTLFGRRIGKGLYKTSYISQAQYPGAARGTRGINRRATAWPTAMRRLSKRFPGPIKRALISTWTRQVHLTYGEVTRQASQKGVLV